MIFFTSDHHFFHKNVIKLSNRPYDSLIEMHKDYINKWNSVISDEDEVFHLGDIFFTENMDLMHNTLAKLNGKKYLILGNHDRKPIGRRQEKFKEFLFIKDYHSITIENQIIILMHYPIEEWNHKNHGSWHLHGHSHGNLNHIITNRLDVGVDVHNGFPLSF